MRKFLSVILTVICAGCSSVTGTRSPQGALTIHATGFLVDTSGLTFKATDQNGFTTSLSLTSQTPDSTAIATLSSGLVTLTEGALGLKAPTNAVPSTNSIPSQP